MDQIELERMVETARRGHQGAVEGSATFRAFGAWASAIHEMVKSLLEQMQKLNELSAAIVKELAASHDLTQAELAKLRRLHEQFEVVQEIFGTRLARAREIAPPPFSVIQGGKDET